MRRLNLFSSGSAALCLGALLTLGCSSPNSQLTRIQQDKEQLLVTIREQRDLNRTLRDQVTSLESRLDQSEKQLARIGGGTRLSSKPSSPLPPAIRTESVPPPRTEPLTWRAPSSKSGGSNSPASGDPKLSGPSISSASGSLAALAQRDSRVQFDSRAGQARLEAPLAFDEKRGTLTAESKRQLDHVAKLLRTDEARDLKITVAGQGSTASAQAVADYLDRHGIAQERLSVSSGPGTSPAAARGDLSAGVQIYLTEADQPLRR
jgi:outer membrane protein OmpA-like peptidoglycan-associated protein